MNDVESPTHDVNTSSFCFICAEVSNRLYSEGFGFDYCKSTESKRAHVCMYENFKPRLPEAFSVLGFLVYLSGGEHSMILCITLHQKFIWFHVEVLNG